MGDVETATGEVDLWIYATQVYGAPGVAPACLRAQDEQGLDVNLLLFAAWLATRGIALDASLLERARACSEPWREAVVGPLRAVRRRWRSAPPYAGAYDAIKSLELEAERRQLEALGALRPAPPESPYAAACAPTQTLLHRNLDAVAAASAAPAGSTDALARLLSAAPMGPQSGARKPPD